MKTIYTFEIEKDIWQIKEAYLKDTKKDLFYYIFLNGEQQSILEDEFETESGAMYAILSQYKK